MISDHRFQVNLTALRFLLTASVLAGLCPDDVAATDDGISLGDRLPKLQQLTTLDGKSADLTNLDAAKVLVVVFTCNRCPYAIDYEERIQALHQYYRDSNDVEILVINSNYGRDESIEQMSKRAIDKAFTFTYLKDESQIVARSLGAVYTPEFFVFDQQQTLAYKGALDDSTDQTKVSVNYVREAVSAILAGRKTDPAKVGARGCTIRFKRRRQKS